MDSMQMSFETGDLSHSFSLSLSITLAYKHVIKHLRVLVFICIYYIWWALRRFRGFKKSFVATFCPSVRNNMFVLCHQFSLLYRPVIIIMASITRICQTTIVLFIPSYSALLNIKYMCIYTHEWRGSVVPTDPVAFNPPAAFDPISWQMLHNVTLPGRHSHGGGIITIIYTICRFAVEPHRIIYTNPTALVFSSPFRGWVGGWQKKNIYSSKPPDWTRLSYCRILSFACVF